MTTARQPPPDDAPEWTDEMFANARPAREVMSEATQALFRPRKVIEEIPDD